MGNRELDKMLTEHIQKYKGDFLNDEIYKGTSFFQKELNNFYGTCLTTSSGPGSGLFLSKKFDLSKEGKKPSLLIEILNPFCEYDPKPNSLEYDLVRQDISKFNKISSYKFGAGSLLWMGGMAGLVAHGHIDSLISLSYFLSFGGGLAFSMFSGISRPRINSPSGQLNNLYNSTWKADELLNRIYGKK